ncbi:acyltransferase domain-containing protein [Streptosporangium lutulentum]
MAMLGHSIGEWVAACLAGVFTLPDALTLVAARGRLIGALPRGSMLAVELTETQARAYEAQGLTIAAVNAPARCVLSGPAEAVERVRAELVERGVAARPLATSHAFHSGALDPMVAPFADLVAAVPRQAPRVPFVSNVTGTWIGGAEATDPRYWGRRPAGPSGSPTGSPPCSACSARSCWRWGPAARWAASPRRPPGPVPPSWGRSPGPRFGFHARRAGRRGRRPVGARRRPRLGRLPRRRPEGRRAAARLPLPAPPPLDRPAGRAPAPLPAPPATPAVSPAPAASVASAAEPVEVAGAEAETDELTGRILALWRDLLGFDELGVTDDLFMLGGDSLVATRLISRADRLFDVEVPLDEFLDEPTVSRMAALVLARLDSPYLAEIGKV